MECVKSSVASLITKSIKIPTIGIGSSVNCDGQVLVTDDLLGLNTTKIKFVKKFVDLKKTINLGIKKEEKAPQAVCPGQNISWFNREYSLMEMMAHFYNKQKSLISEERPHMFAKEIQMYVDYFDRLIKKSDLNERTTKTLNEFYENMKSGMEYCRTFSQKQPFTSENIDSINVWIDEQSIRLEEIYENAFGELVEA